MTTPGSNILQQAMRAVASQTLSHRAWVSRAVNSAGDYVSTYATATNITGSFQPLSATLYQTLGLNLAKAYCYLYTSANVRATARDREGDLLTFDGRTWLCESDQNWRAVDGWRKILCIEVPA